MDGIFNHDPIPSTHIYNCALVCVMSMSMLVVHVRAGDDIIIIIGDGGINPWPGIYHDYVVLMSVVHVYIGDDVVFSLGDDDIIPRLSSIGCVYYLFVGGIILVFRVLALPNKSGIMSILSISSCSSMSRIIKLKCFHSMSISSCSLSINSQL